jgi:S1-C subfamily serine protease
VTFVDVLLIGIVLFSAVSGFRRGAALQLAVYAGLLGGLLVGALVAPPIARLADQPTSQALLALIILLGLAALGDGVGWLVGTRIWMRARKSVLGSIDAVAGSLVAVVAVLLAMWFLAFNLVNGPFPTLSREIRRSVLVQGMSNTLPHPPSLFASARQFLNRFGFPEVFAGLPPPPAGPVDRPSEGDVAEAAAHAEGSTVRIVGEACGRIQEGSGFVASDGYVVTNAHVVAGVEDPSVQRQNERRSFPALTVLFDPNLDIAILRTQGLAANTLMLDGSTRERGDSGAVLGFPRGGPLTIGDAAVRRPLSATGRDIYGRSTVTRDVYELQTQVRAGNSGGPFVLPTGEVAGVVFAASTTDPQVGYAIQSTEVIPLVSRASERTREVSTGDCLR